MDLLKLSVTSPPLRRLRYKLRNFIKYTVPELLLIVGCVAVFMLIWVYFFTL